MTSPELTGRVRTAHGDAWQAQGRLRTPYGGGVAELPGIRLMASGLPHPQWNNGDVTDPSAVDLEAVRSFYRDRDVPWGVTVPAGTSWRHGRRLLYQRCMGLRPAAFRPAPPVADLRLRRAVAADADTVAAVDAAAFDQPIEENRPWVAPQVGAPGFTVALAELGTEPVGIGVAIRTSGPAGECTGLFGIGVVPAAWRRGIAAALSSWLVALALADGATLLHLNPDTDAAARVYARLGFVETDGFDIYVEV